MQSEARKSPLLRDSVRSRHGQHKAFTLVDLLVAMVILTVALTSFIGISTQSAEISPKARLERMAAIFAQTWVEGAKGNAFGRNLTSIDRTTPLSAYMTSDLPANATFCWIVRPLDNNAANRQIYEAWAIVTWTGTPASVSGSITTYAVITLK